MRPKMVIFDCDGVVVDSEKVTNIVLQDNLERYGLRVEIDDILRLFVGGTISGVGEQAREMGADLPVDWVDQMYGEMFTALADQVEPVVGIVEVLDRLDQAGIPYAIGSNGPHAKMDITLERCGLAERFEGLRFSREDVANPKPAPDVYLKAAQQAGVDPKDCVVVEDSPSGAKAGQAAGMRVFGYVEHGDASRMAPFTDAIFHDMADLPGLLKL